MKIIYLFCLMMILTITTSAFSQPDTRKSFSIHLLPKSIKSTELAQLDLKRIKPFGKPLIHQDDIFIYNRDRHEFTVYSNVIDKLITLKPEITHRPFAVFVGDEAIYVGVFWSSISSQSFDGIFINPFHLKKESSVLRLAAGYPTGKYFKGLDLRSDPRILQAFGQVNKLYEELEILGKCKEIKPTYKHLPSQIFTFEIIKILKGNFAEKEISFELGFFAGHNNSGKLRDDLRNGSLVRSLKNLWEFDPEKEVLLRFVQPVSGENPQPQIVSWEVIKK